MTGVDDFRVNRWMRKHGFVWFVFPGTSAKPNPFEGEWRKEYINFTHEQARVLYRNFKKWWEK